MTVLTQNQNLYAIQKLEAVAERDIDLLFIEELNVSKSFRSWLYGMVWETNNHDLPFLGAWHSLTHPEYGESDIAAIFKDLEGRKAAILIENKIDAPAQPNQAARYRSRGDAGIEKTWWHKYRTCMIAPQAYLDANSEAELYDVRISYESIKEWFQHVETDCRSAYRAEVVGNAIEQNRRGYKPIPHGGVTQFWLDYWELSRIEFSELRMRKPNKIPARSDWPRFKPQGLKPNFVVIHKWRRGVVDLTILGDANAVDQIIHLNGDLLGDGVTVLPTGNSAAIRIDVPMVDRFAGFQAQIEKVRAGLSAASRLVELSHQVKL